MPRIDLLTYPRLRMTAVLLVLAGMGATAVRAALGPWHRPTLSVGRAWTWVVGGVTTALVMALLPEAHVLLPHSAPPPGEALWQHAGRCLAFGLSFGAPVFLLTWWVGRGTAYSGLVATVVAGLVGNLVLQLHCPITEHTHLLVGHGSVGVVALLLLGIPGLAQMTRSAPRMRSTP